MVTIQRTQEHINYWRVAIPVETPKEAMAWIRHMEAKGGYHLRLINVGETRWCAVARFAKRQNPNTWVLEGQDDGLGL